MPSLEHALRDLRAALQIARVFLELFLRVPLVAEAAGEEDGRELDGGIVLDVVSTASTEATGARAAAVKTAASQPSAVHSTSPRKSAMTAAASARRSWRDSDGCWRGTERSLTAAVEISP